MMDPEPLTVMTHNLGAGLAEPARLVGVLRAAGADLVGLQELAPGQAAAIERDLADVYPFRFLRRSGSPARGCSAASRCATRRCWICSPAGRRAGNDRGAGRPADRRRRPPAAAPARPPLAENAAAAGQVAGVVAAVTAGGPAVLLADVNRVAWQGACRRLAAAGLVDAFASAGLGHGATSPTRLVAGGRGRLALPPFLRIDYVWHTPTSAPSTPGPATTPAPTTGRCWRGWFRR
jgi:endonuclease/exonuclease/phosphatase (EEP) superfamily protein YafD